MVSEVCAEEGLDLLLAFDFGPPGMCTLRASITRVALTKACTLALLAGYPANPWSAGSAWSTQLSGCV
jgi:hypothetical protein